MNSKNARKISIIVPTRGRPDGVRRLLDSFKATTANLGALELVLVVDSDDRPTLDFTYDGVPLKRVVVQPALKMGELNMAGYEAADGDYIMLLNDDVILRTQAWDEQVVAAFKSFSDEIVLVHVNDKIFGEKLCTFPFLSRKYCEIAGGICPRDYVRYRIDDHIYNVFNLLAVMGKVRILYLPEVVFEHTNYVLRGFGGVEYRPDESIHEIDSKHFHELLEERKIVALRLIEHIERAGAQKKLRVRQKLLEPIADSVALRRPEYVKVWSDSKPISSDNTRVTIGVVTANLMSDHARTCVDLVKKYTKNFDLIILDNNRRSAFNHPQEMNKLLSLCDTDYLVLMDDDVFVEPGWLDGMLRCMGSSVGVVTPLHKDCSGSLSYAGVVMRPDHSGHHTHILAAPDRPTRIQTLCSAIVLIDMAKCGHIRFDESYSKYFLDIDYGFQIWLAGYEVVCSPYSMVTHIGGATLQQGSAVSNDLFELQRQHFVREWVHTGRYRQLERGIWSEIPEIQHLLCIPGQIDALINDPDGDRELFRTGARNLFTAIRNHPALAHWAAQRVWDALGGNRPSVDDPELGYLGFLLGCIPYAVVVEENFEGLNIVLYNADYYAIPQTEGAFEYGRVVQGGYTRCYQAESVNVLKARIRGGVSDAVPAKVEAKDSKGRVQALSRELIEAWRTLKNEKARLRSWTGALQAVSKQFVKTQIIATFGIQGFVKLKDIYWKTKEHRIKRGAFLGYWFGFKLVFREGTQALFVRRTSLQFRNIGVQKRRNQSQIAKAQPPDPQRWLNASPANLVESDYRGYSIYRFEYKFFALKRGAESFSYENYAHGNYDPHLVRHSLGEVYTAIDHFLCSKNTGSSQPSLVLACLPALELRPLLQQRYPPGSATLLVTKSHSNDWMDYNVISVEQGTLFEWARSYISKGCDPCGEQIVNEEFDHITIPWKFPETWRDNTLEIAASKLAKRVEVLYSSGDHRMYQGENLHRLCYNKAYLASMFQVVPPPEGKTILEAGCSDGLVCDILALAGAEKVVGIDVMKTVGCSFPNGRIEYQVMDISHMDFAHETFDLVYSIATFQHLANPYQALREILRAVKRGGYGYIQAGPLYYSPFGHHMFDYFGDCPWIHLRKSKDEIVAYSKEKAIDKHIERNLAMTCEQYVEGMLSRDHVNGLLLEDYRLEEFKRRKDVEILKFNISYEGSELLTPEIAAEMPGLDHDRLVEHGFEIAFRRVK